MTLPNEEDLAQAPEWLTEVARNWEAWLDALM